MNRGIECVQHRRGEATGAAPGDVEVGWLGSLQKRTERKGRRGARVQGKERGIEIGRRVTSWSSESSGRGRRYVGLRREISRFWQCLVQEDERGMEEE
jgi:hypothetical protein